MENSRSFWWPINLLLYIYTFQVNCFLQRPKVTTTLGVFIGEYKNLKDMETNEVFKVSQFLSVPYAKPPVENLRFRKPEPITKLPTSFYKCYRMPKHCNQNTNTPFHWKLDEDIEDGWFSEDCLYLNIWVPPGACQLNKKSIFFWIHGGGFNTGSISQDFYNGKKLAAFGDIIVVTVNYRLGITGFWGSGTETAPGNLAIWDVIQALRWVKEHIEAFGGDKDSVTIAGQDAGAVIVSLLAVTPQAQGLFKRQIVQSGSAMFHAMDNPNQFKLFTGDIAKRVGCYVYDSRQPPDLEEKCMREEVYNEVLLKEERNLTLDVNATYSAVFPRWGGDLFNTVPRKLLKETKLNFTELLIGNNGNEGYFMLLKSLPNLRPTRKEYIDILRNALVMIAGKYQKSRFEGLDKIIALYLPEEITETDELTLRIADALGDFLFVCPTIFYATRGKQSGASVYYYDFEYGPTRGNHFSEMPYVFGHHIPLKDYKEYELNLPKQPSEISNRDLVEVRLSRMMVEDWSNFVKYGKPNDKWPKYGEKAERYVYVNDNLQVLDSGDHRHKCKDWWEYIYQGEQSILPHHSEMLSE